MNLQHGKPFYHGGNVQGEWRLNRSFHSVVKYLNDLGQNLVLADSKCNGKKRHAKGSAFVRSRLYESDRLLGLSADAGAHGLFRGDELRELSPEWRNYLALLDTWHELLRLRLLKL
jgi:hypothetical protein